MQLTRRARNSIEAWSLFLCDDIHLTLASVSRLYAHSKNYDMDLTLDYNFELFPLKNGESFALALASSLDREGIPSMVTDGDEETDKDRHKWRPDGKGKRGLEEDYEYVMYGKVSIILNCPRTQTIVVIHLAVFPRYINSTVELPKSCTCYVVTTNPV